MEYDINTSLVQNMKRIIYTFEPTTNSHINDKGFKLKKLMGFGK
jgi:hypothetical protein